MAALAEAAVSNSLHPKRDASAILKVVTFDADTTLL